MALIGSYALLLAFALSVYSFLFGLLALAFPGEGSERVGETARRAGVVVFGAVLLAAVALVVAAFRDDFSIAYIFHHSNRDLPAPYKFATLWSGQEGSLLFWSLLLAGYGFVLRLRYKTDPRLFAYASVVLAGVQVFFLALVRFAANPFGLIEGPLRPDGSGLNPLLQYPEMVIHPPMLYLGYVGFTIPFAFALAALLGRYPGEKWIHLTRKWTMIAWCFQSVGILRGAHWAYAVLGWGGYWAWDPVENASLMPWLTGTAFLHSVMMQEKRGMLRVWNVWLVFTTFLLCILGTFLTRSGVVSSVHAFAQSSIGPWFLGFIIFSIAVCLWAYLKNRDYLRSDNQLDSLVSRESSFLFNNLILLVACVAVVSGTLFPVLSEWVQGSKISVGPPFFNKINIPIGLFLLFLTGVGPLLAWRRTSLDSLKRNFGWPLLGGLAVGAILFPLGFRDFYALVCVVLSVFVSLTIFSEFFRGARVIRGRTGTSLLAAVVQLTMRNTRRYGGYVVHFGMVLIFVGLAGAAFNQDKQMEMAPGSRMSIGPYTLICQTFTSRPERNYTAERATLEAVRGNKSVMMLYPERRFYPANEQSGTMVAIYSTLKEDLYVVYAGRSPENDQPVIHAYLNPLVKWIWLGGVVVVFGTVLALLPNRQAVLVVRAAAEKVATGAAAQAIPAPVRTYEGND
jgi:cytochrome c-type biogenesis protein CcmF